MYVCLRLERNPHPQCRPSDLAGPSGPGRIPLLGFLGLGLLLPAVRNIGITIVEVILTIVVRLVLLNLVGAGRSYDPKSQRLSTHCRARNAAAAVLWLLLSRFLAQCDPLQRHSRLA